MALGPLLVRPMERTIVAADGAARTLEPRVMQVLVALGRARGGVVSRDALIARCWEGRIVSDAAINRTIAQLRALAGHGDAFRIETIAGVGYRLVAPAPPTAPRSEADAGAAAAAYPYSAEMAVADAPPPAHGQAPQPDRDAARAGLPRRAMLAAGLAGAAALAGTALWRQRAGRPAGGAGDDPVVDELVDRGRVMVREGRFGRPGDAVALLVRATELAPQRADAWGLLALAYRQNVAAPVDRDWVRASAARAGARPRQCRRAGGAGNQPALLRQLAGDRARHPPAAKALSRPLATGRVAGLADDGRGAVRRGRAQLCCGHRPRSDAAGGADGTGAGAVGQGPGDRG